MLLYALAARSCSPFTTRMLIRHTSNLRTPRIGSPSVWDSIIPKGLRRRQGWKTSSTSRHREWNPATFYIFIFLVIGSNAIQMIALRNSNQAFERKAEARVSLLRETIKRIQRGEAVDPKGILGSGDDAQEQEWTEVMKELASMTVASEDSQKGQGPPLLEQADPTSSTEQVTLSSGDAVLSREHDNNAKRRDIGSQRFNSSGRFV